MYFKIWYLLAVAVILLSVLAYFGRRIGASSDIRTQNDGARRELDRGAAWREAFAAAVPAGASDRPGLPSLQMAAWALAFPKFDLVINRYLHPRMMKFFIKKVAERRALSLKAQNDEVLKVLFERFPGIPAQDADDVRGKAALAAALFDDFLDGEVKALESLEGKRNLKSLAGKIGDLRVNTLNTFCSYQKAACAARQAVVGLSLSAGERVAAAPVESILRETAANDTSFAFKTEMETSQRNFGEAVKRLNLPEELMAEITTLIAAYPSPRWACCPLVPGERFLYTGVWSNEKGAVTNAVYVYVLETPHRICAVPLALVQKVEDDPHNKKNVLLTVTGGEVLSAPRVGRGINKALKRVIEARGIVPPLRTAPELEAQLLDAVRAAQ